MSLGLVNQAWAADVQCNTAGSSIKNQNGAVLANCQINADISNDNRAALSIENSQNFNIQNANVNAFISDDEKYSGEVIGANISDSTGVFNNVSLHTTSTNSREIGMKVDNATLTINDGSFTSHSVGDYVSEVFNLENSTVTMNNVTILPVGEAAAAIELRKRNQVILNNANITTSNDARIFQYEVADDSNNSSLTVNNSNLTALGKGPLLDALWSTSENRIGRFSLILNNTTANSSVLTYFGSTDIDEENPAKGQTVLTEHINFVANDSTLVGTFADNSNENLPSELNVSLTNSSWTTAPYTDPEDNQVFHSTVTNLTLSNSNVNLSKVDGFQALTILNELSGSGNFTLNTDLASQQGDKIVVNGKDSGSFGLSVQDSGNEPNAANGSVTLVETQTGTAQFSLLGKDYVDAGAYRYRLNKSGNNWVLSNRSGESATASNTNSGNGGTTANNGSGTNTGATTEKVALSEQSNALVSLRQAQLLLVEGNLAGLHQRLGELKKGEQGNVWVRNSNHRNKLDSLSVAENAETSGFKQRVNSTQVGADFAATDSIRVGGFVGNARSNVDFEGEYGSGKVRSQTVGLYGTYLADNGFYFDNVVKYERLKSESNRTGERKYNGYTLSSEIGRIHTLGSWTVTPQLQAAWTKLSGQDDEERLTALTARAGVRVANQLSLGEWQLQPYAEVNGITTKTNSNAVQVNQYRFDVAESRGRIQTALGVNAALGQHRVGLEGSVTNGKHLDQPYQIQAVYRYSW